MMGTVIATLLQIVGAACLVVAAFLVHLTLGVLVTGVVLLAFGIMLEAPARSG